MQTDATSWLTNSQQCCLHVASVCTPCCMLLRVVGSCCAKFETGQTFRYVQTDATTLNNVASVCTGLMISPAISKSGAFYSLDSRICFKTAKRTRYKNALNYVKPSQISCCCLENLNVNIFFSSLVYLWRVIK